MKPSYLVSPRLRARGCLIVLLSCAVANPIAWAAATDISNTPLASTSDITAKPNVMFVLDGSGSMAWSFMPDDLGLDSDGDKTDTAALARYGGRASQCNGLAYNPSFKYEENLPVRADGTPYPHASFTAAPSDGFQASATSANGLTAPINMGTGDQTFIITTNSPSTSNITKDNKVVIYNTANDTQWMIGTVKSWSKPVVTVTITDMVGNGDPSASTWRIGTRSVTDLTNSHYYTYSGNKPALGWKYTTAGLNKNGDGGFANECLTSTSSASSVFTKVTLTAATSEEQRQRYADWYAYYRKRYLMMRTVAGRSFKPIDEKFRVGFSTIADTTATPSTTFLEVNAFDATQKKSFYSNLYKADPDGSTPLRGALSKVGRYFANKAPGQQNDPMQYACQRNYTILSTDGYWNTGLETSSYGPLKLDGSTKVGQQDALEERPMYDGATVTVKTKKTWTTTSVKVDTTVTPRSTVSTSSVTTKTFTPLRGLDRNSYSLTNIQGSVTNTGLARCGATLGTCTITATTSSNHNFTAGNSVTITGASPSSYNGTYTILTTPSATSYTYRLSSRPNAATAAGSASSSCKALVTQLQHGDEYTVATSTATDTTTTSSTKTDVKTTTVVTPWTNTVIYVNDVLNSQTGDVAGTATTTNPTVSNTVTGTTTVTPSVTTGTSANVIDWNNSGSPTTGNACVAALPSPNPSNPVSAALSSSATVYSGAPGAPVLTGPTLTAGAGVLTTVGPTVVSTPVVTDETTTIAGGSTNSLADVAEYYYITDLRTSDLNNCTGALGHDVCSNEVPPSGRDTAANQHMTTFTLGLGVNGILDYRTNYLNPSQIEGAYYDILNNRNGTAWPNPSASEDATHVDDLWHAAVNGRGQYWATSDPGSLSDAISTALSSVKASAGASSSAATSSLKPVAGDDNLVFVATFKTVDWFGDLIAYTLDAKNGVIDLTHPVWSAKTQLDAKSVGSRQIYYAKPNATTPSLVAFNYANLSGDGYGSVLDNLCNQASVAGQCATLPPSLKTMANSGTNLVNYLRGDGSLTDYTYTYTPTGSTETVTVKMAIYRPRQSVLGDIINASPVYVSKPPFHYADTGYADYVASKATRKAVVYVAANDGMLHAFAAKASTADNTQGGDELWAYVPRAVIPNLHLLADIDYKDKHRYFVDGTPTIGDIYVNGAWKTILVGGLNAGGKSYYALDITNPLAPKALWEFTDDHLGLTYGNPIITKRADGTWVVVFSSGYNNGVGNGDGNGRLYVLDANTGVAPTGTPAVGSIPTMVSEGVPAGTTATPSGLGKINAWIDDSSNNTAKRFYGGDLLGNLWRFDIDHLVNPKGKALLLATFKTSDTKPQPIMTRPETAEVTYNSVGYPVILVGTGRYLGISDIADKSVQSVYAIKDPLTDTGLGNVRQRTDVIVQTLTNLPADEKGTIAKRKSSSNTVDWSQSSGWRVDLPSSGERVAIDMQLQYNTLAMISAIPGTNECKPAGGSSWLYTFDIAKGVAPSTAGGTTGTYLGDFLGVGLTWIELGDGTSRLIVPGSDASMHVKTPPSPGSSTGTKAHRTSWRELLN